MFMRYLPSMRGGGKIMAASLLGLMPFSARAGGLSVENYAQGLAPDGRKMAYFEVVNSGPEDFRGVEYSAGGAVFRIPEVRPNSRVGVYAFPGEGGIVLGNGSQARGSDPMEPLISEAEAIDVLDNSIGYCAEMREPDGGGKWQFVVGSTAFQFDAAVNRILTEGGDTSCTRLPLETAIPQTAAMDVVTPLSPADQALWLSVGNFYKFESAAAHPTVPDFALAAQPWWNQYIEAGQWTSVEEPPKESWGTVKALFRE